MKTCSKCGCDKPESEFFKNKNSSDGLRSECKVCFGGFKRSPEKYSAERARIKQAKYREKNREMVNAKARISNKIYRDKLKEEIKNCPVWCRVDANRGPTVGR